MADFGCWKDRGVGKARSRKYLTLIIRAGRLAVGAYSSDETSLLQKNGGKGCHTGQDLEFSILISYRRMEEKDVIVDRTLFSLLFPTKEWRKGCHCGQDLVFSILIFYKRMEEKDVIVDRTLSIIS